VTGNAIAYFGTTMLYNPNVHFDWLIFFQVNFINFFVSKRSNTKK
jgi:hypothetical protein